MTLPDPPRATDRGLLVEFREAVASAGYSESAVESLDRRSRDRRQKSTLDGAKNDPAENFDREDVQLLLDVFGYGARRALPRVERALGGFSVERLLPIGLVVLEDGMVAAPVRLRPTDGFLLASDYIGEGTLARDVVIGVHPATRTSLSASVRKHVERALDLGTGTGIHAFCAARHADWVWASDVSGRALAFARFNAELNGVENVEFREGSWFDPFEGEEFGFIVSNPPFVISPESSFTYRDGGFEADGTSRQVVARSCEHLGDGGYAHVVCNWVGRGDEHFGEPVFEWTSGLGCDTLVIRYGSVFADAYARSWNGGVRQTSQAAFDAAVATWMSEFERLGIEQIDSGMVITRRASGKNWSHAIDARRWPDAPAGEEVERIFGARDYLRERGSTPEGLLGTVFKMAEGHRIEQSLTHEDGIYRSHPAVVRMAKGSGVRAEIPARNLDIVFGLDGKRPLGHVVADIADRNSSDDGRLREEAVGTIESLLDVGLIEICNVSH